MGDPWGVKCPKCGAKKGAPCKVKNPFFKSPHMTEVHMERVTLADTEAQKGEES